MANPTRGMGKRPGRKPVCCRIPLGQGVVGIGVGWGPGDGDSVVALYLVQEGIDTGDDLLVGNQFDGAGGKQFDTVKTVRYKIVTQCEGGARDRRLRRIQSSAW